MTPQSPSPPLNFWRHALAAFGVTGGSVGVEEDWHGGSRRLKK